MWIAGKNKVEPEPRALGAKAKDAIDAWLAARLAAGIEADFIFTGFAGRGDSRVTQVSRRRPSTACWTRCVWALRMIWCRAAKERSFRAVSP